MGKDCPCTKKCTMYQLFGIFHSFQKLLGVTLTPLLKVFIPTRESGKTLNKGYNKMICFFCFFIHPCYLFPLICTLGIPLLPFPPPNKPDKPPDDPLEPWCVQGPEDDPGGRAEGAGTPQQPVRHSGASKPRN